MELKLKLATWGKCAPYRLNRRGQKKLCEAFCLNRYLTYRLEREEISFPLAIKQHENPDFLLTNGSVTIGIEVTEACCESEQAEWTRRAKIAEKDDDSVIYDTNNTDSGRALRVKKMVHDAVARKALKVSNRVDELLVYLNTLDDAFESNEWRTSAIGVLPDIASRFLNIWLLTGVGVIKLYTPLGAVPSGITK